MRIHQSVIEIIRGFYRGLFLFIIILLSISCSIEGPVLDSQNPELPLLGEYDLSVAEPSGLTLNKDYSALWTVSDNSNKVYEISLSGQTMNELSFTGNDLEGVAYDSSENTLWLVEEQLREVVHIDVNGNELSRHSIYLPGNGNSGLEGICLDPEQHKYLLNEKAPALWAKMNKNFSISRQKEISDVDDLSGITWDSNRNMFWIVSDASKSLFLWDPDQGTVSTYGLTFEKAEGVAYDPVLDRLYVVSDATEKLYIYELSEAEK